MRLFMHLELTDYPLLFQGSRATIHPYFGLVKWGPFMQPSEFEYEEVAIIGKDGRFLQHFKTHLSEGLGGKFPGGFNNIFKTDLDLEFYQIDDEEDEEIIFDEFKSNGLFRRFPVVIIPKTPRSDYNSLYYRVKSKFLENGIPSQIFTRETTLDENTYSWSIFPLAIQIFAKMGGVPYVLAKRVIGEASDTTSRILVLGVGMSSSPLERDRIAGFVTIYDENGQWLLSKVDTEKNPSKEVFASKLKEMILDAINISIKKLNVDLSRFSVLIHYSGKEMSGHEEETLWKAIQDAKDSLGVDVGVYVVKINNSNYIAASSISKCHHNGLPTGLINTGTVFQLKDFYLLFTTGCIPEFPNRRGEPSKNITKPSAPSPIIVSIKEIVENKRDMSPQNLISSVYAMCRMNYTSINNQLNRLPVTVKYSREIAWMTLRLGKMSNERIEKVLWFI